jgi:hypothetical protein
MLYSLDTTRDLGKDRQQKRGVGRRSLWTAGEGRPLAFPPLAGFGRRVTPAKAANTRQNTNTLRE